MNRYESLQKGIRENFPALVLLLVAGGFALTAVELVMMHHTEGKQVIGVVATGAGALVALVGLWAKGGAKGVVALLFGALALSGLFGMVEHLEGEEEEERQAFRWEQPAQAWLTSQTAAFAEEEDDDEEEAQAFASDSAVPTTETGLATDSPVVLARGEAEGEHEEGEKGEGEEGEHGPPPLAPLSVTGLALMGAAAVIAKQS